MEQGMVQLEQAFKIANLAPEQEAEIRKRYSDWNEYQKGYLEDIAKMVSHFMLGKFEPTQEAREIGAATVFEMYLVMEDLTRQIIRCQMLLANFSFPLHELDSPTTPIKKSREAAQHGVRVGKASMASMPKRKM
jgi:hypothetical protein